MLGIGANFAQIFTFVYVYLACRNVMKMSLQKSELQNISNEFDNIQQKNLKDLNLPVVVNFKSSLIPRADFQVDSLNINVNVNDAVKSQEQMSHYYIIISITKSLVFYSTHR